MRISDWNSDVCSSDLTTGHLRVAFAFLEVCMSAENEPVGTDNTTPTPNDPAAEPAKESPKPDGSDDAPQGKEPNADPTKDPAEGKEERKSVVKGKRRAVREDIGGRRILKKKKT